MSCCNLQLLGKPQRFNFYILAAGGAVIVGSEQPPLEDQHDAFRCQFLKFGFNRKLVFKRNSVGLVEAEKALSVLQTSLKANFSFDFKRLGEHITKKLVRGSLRFLVFFIFFLFLLMI